MSRSNENVLDVSFLKSEETPFEFDVMRIEDFYRRDLDHQPDHPHRIHFNCLLFVTEGNGVHFIDFEEFAYRPRDLVFVTEKQIHKFDFNLEARGYIIIFTKEFLYEKKSDNRILQGSRIFDYSLKAPVLSLGKKEFPQFLDLADQIDLEKQSASNDRLTREIVHCLLKTILLKAERLKREQIIDPVVERSYLDFTKFREAVEEGFSRSRIVQSYGRTLGMSAKKLNALTRANVNQTAKEFIDERVILEIKRLLVHTDNSVQEISNQVGFDEHTNLVKYFKRHVEMTPSEFRKTN